jgi:type I restriction enzyme S subunit
MASVRELGRGLDPSATRLTREVRRKSYRYFEENDVIMAKITPCFENGKIAIARGLRSGRAFGSTEFHVLRPRAGIADSAFIKTFLESPAFMALATRSMSGAVGQRRVPTRIVAEAAIPLPPIDQQGHIVSVIEELLSPLEAAVQSIEAAEARVVTLRRSVYHYLLQGSWPSVPLATVVEPERPITYGILMPKENVPDGVPYVRVKDMNQDGINLAGLRRTSTSIAGAYRRSMLRSGDVLVSIRGTYGRVAIVPAQLDGANVTQDTARVAPGAAVLSAYLAAALRAPASQAFMARVSRGVAVKGVNLGDLKVLPIPLPPIHIQAQIVAHIQDQTDRIARFDSVVTVALLRAKRLRQSILNAAFTGGLVKSAAASQTASMLVRELDRLPSKTAQ